jgi:hypothetical protein
MPPNLQRLLLMVSFCLIAAAQAEKPKAPAVASEGESSFGIPPKTLKPSLEGTPYGDYKTPSPRVDTSKPKLRYKNGKLVEDTTPPVIMLSSELGDSSSGRLVVPAYVGDVAYLSMLLQTESQTPLPGKRVTVRSTRGQSTLLMRDTTDSEGYLDFRVLAGSAGRDTITVEAEGVTAKLTLDVKEAPVDEWLGELDLRGVTPWSLLIGTPLDLGREQIVARFPAELRKLDGKMVRLAGFMLPLETSAKQRHFLLTANPPACFFHPPGGPTSVAEVFAKTGIEASYDALVIEGRLKLIEKSDSGLMFRLDDARLVSRS